MMIKMMKSTNQLRQWAVLCFLVVLCFTGHLLAGDVELAGVFGDNMVLQREQKIPIWGKAPAGKVITVKFGEFTVTCQADAKGYWKVTIGPLVASKKPAKLIVNDVTISNVLVGDVWLCSGQSNMEWWMGMFDDTKQDIAEAGKYPEIRIMDVGRFRQASAKGKRLMSQKTGWFVSSPIVVSSFSGAGYYFGLNLRKHLDVPIGLIGCNRGGTVAETWISEKALGENKLLKKIVIDPWQKDLHDEGLQKRIDESKKLYAAWRKRKDTEKAGAEKAGPAPKILRAFPAPSGLFKSMVKPLIGFGIKGVIWYQGESNAGCVSKNYKASKEYYHLLTTLIKDWRTRWGQGDFAFLIVQLPSGSRRRSSPVNEQAWWPHIRDGQRLAVHLPNTALAVICDNKDTVLHPSGKAVVGQRLALAARAIAYKEDIVYSGPLYVEDSLKIVDGKAVLRFAHIGGGMILKKTPVSGFAIREKGGKWQHAKVEIDGDTIIAWSELVVKPEAVRYLWNSGITPSLYNKEGLPASPFKTDPIKHLNVLILGNSKSGPIASSLRKLVAATPAVSITTKGVIAGGSVLKGHWDNRNKPYYYTNFPKKIHDDTLVDILKSADWDCITIQQGSYASAEAKTYYPYIDNLKSIIKDACPKAKLFLYAVSAYREDSGIYPKINMTNPQLQKMINEANQAVAKQVGAVVIPVGSAFGESYRQKPYAIDKENFDFENPKPHTLPKEANSLQIGWKWNKKGKLGCDSNHLNEAGKYLAAAVFYEVLFSKDIREIKPYRPDGMTSSYARYLRDIAHKVVDQQRQSKPQRQEK